jgi:hypothetical protein
LAVSFDHDSFQTKTINHAGTFFAPKADFQPNYIELGDLK